MRRRTFLKLACLAPPLAAGAQTARTEVSIEGERFLINGKPTYAGRRYRDMKVEGLLLNVRAVQAIFDDANYPRQGSRVHPYQSNTLGDIFWDYPDGP